MMSGELRNKGPDPEVREIYEHLLQKISENIKEEYKRMNYALK